VRTGGVESRYAQRYARGYNPLSSRCSASAGKGQSAGFEPEPRGSRPRMLPLHHDHHVSGDDRTRTGACSPDKRVLLPLSYVPLHSAGGIRTHGLELMRLAGTATPLRRESARLESNQRSPAPKAGGVANSPTGRRSNDDVGGGTCFPQTGRRVAQNASRCHPLLVGTPASHRRGPPGRCPLPLATPDARYGPRTA
jgi:hypothetical protein